MHNCNLYILDKNECELQTAKCTQNCANTAGSYTCSCTEEYILDDDTYTCKSSKNW